MFFLTLSAQSQSPGGNGSFSTAFTALRVLILSLLLFSYLFQPIGNHPISPALHMNTNCSSTSVYNEQQLSTKAVNLFQSFYPFQNYADNIAQLKKDFSYLFLKHSLTFSFFLLSEPVFFVGQ